MGLLEKAIKISGSNGSSVNRKPSTVTDQSGEVKEPLSLEGKNGSTSLNSENDDEKEGLLAKANAIRDSYGGTTETVVEETRVDGDKTDSESISGKGLLERAEEIITEERGAKIEPREQEQGGLLDRAEKILKGVSEKESEEERVESKGLMERAKQVLEGVSEEEATEVKRKEEKEPEIVTEVVAKKVEEERAPKGLLQKAQQIVAEGEKVEEQEVYEEPEATGERESAFEEEKVISEEEQIETYEESFIEEEAKGGLFSEEIFSAGKMIEEESSKIEKEISTEISHEVEYEGEGLEKIEPKGKEIGELDPFSLLKKSLTSEDTNNLNKNVERIVSEEGFSKLGEVILDILISFSGGEAGVIFGKDDGVFVPFIYSKNVNKDIKKKYRLLTAKIKKNEKLTSTLLNIEGPVLSKDKKAPLILDAVNIVKKIESWMLIPFVSMGVIYGLAFIINIDEKKRIPRKQINMLKMAIKDKFALEVLQNRVVRIEDDLKVYNENQNILSLIRKNLLGKSIDFKKAFKELCNGISIDIASLVVISKNYNEVVETIGMSEESCLSYTVSKVMSKINKYIKKGKTTFVKDVKAEQFGLVGEDAKKADTLVLVPILYQGVPYGVLIIHRFTQKIKRITPELSSKLSLFSEYLLPILLEYRLKEINPVDLIIEKIDEAIKWSGKAKKKVTFLNVKLKGIYEAVQKTGFKRFVVFYSNIKKLIKDGLDKNNDIIFLYPDRVIVIVKEGTEDIEDYKSKLEDNLRNYIKKQKLFNDIKIKIELSSYISQLKSIPDIFNFLVG